MGKTSLWPIAQGGNGLITLTATDVDSTNFTYIVSQEPQHGIFFVQGSSGTMWYQPAHGFYGTDTIRFVVSDGENLSEESFAVIQVPAPFDSDSDGMPEWWENLHDVNSTVGDRDGDGFTNFSEYLANTSPNDPADFLRILSVRREVLGTRVSWSSVGGVRYRILSTDDLTSPFQAIERPASVEIDPSRYGERSVHSYLDIRAAPTLRSRFYRVQVLSQ